MEIIAKAIKLWKEVKCIQNEKEGVKLSLFTDNMILYIEKSKYRYTHKLLELINSSSCRIQDQNTKVISFSIHLQWTTGKWNQGNNSIYNSVKMNKHWGIIFKKTYITYTLKTSKHLEGY